MADLELTDRYDDVLLTVPWRVKQDGEKTYLFKFAPHPERTGYIIVTTDLVTVHYEVLFGPPLPARLRSSVHQIPEDHRPPADEDEDDDPFEAVERGLKSLAGLFEDRWHEVVIEVKEDRTYDLVIHVQTSDFAWIFNLTELRGRRPLSFISRHLISPLTSILAQDRQISTPRDQNSELIEQTKRLLADEGIQKSMRRVMDSQTDIQGVDTDAEAKGLTSRGESKASAGRSHLASTSRHASSSLSPAPSRTPRNAKVAAHHRVQSSESVSPSRQSKATGNEKRRSVTPSPSPSPSLSPSPSPEKDSMKVQDKTRTRPDSKAKPRSKKDEAVNAKAKAEAEGGAEGEGERIPTQLLSQRSKREREKEEEEEVERRMAEMRKKMASGGGGKLGRRRLGR